MNFLLTITDALKTGQRKRRMHRFVVFATSQAAVIPTFALTHGLWLTPGSDVTVQAYGHAVVVLS
jgi:hypothetical protein